MFLSREEVERGLGFKEFRVQSMTGLVRSSMDFSTTIRNSQIKRYYDCFSIDITKTGITCTTFYWKCYRNQPAVPILEEITSTCIQIKVGKGNIKPHSPCIIYYNTHGALFIFLEICSQIILPLIDLARFSKLFVISDN